MVVTDNCKGFVVVTFAALVVDLVLVGLLYLLLAALIVDVGFYVLR